MLSANHQEVSIDTQVERFIGYLSGLSATEALTKAGILAQVFWLRP